jgi:hypothetical protein
MTAKMLRGELAMEYDLDFWLHNQEGFGGHLALMNAFLENPDFVFWFSIDLINEVTNLDAATADPSDAMRNERVIGEKGVQTPVASSRVANASIGTLPRILSYFIILSRDGGLFRAQPFTGLKHGPLKKWHSTEKKKSRLDEGEMHHNTRPWTRYMTEEQQEHIKAQAYAVPAKAFRKYDKAKGSAGALRAEMQKRDFTPLFFLVCASHSKTASTAAMHTS